MSDPAEVITVTLGDKTFRAGRRTAAHIRWTIDELEREFPEAYFHIIQPCYNDGVGASEGTHDLDGCIDVDIVGMTGLQTQTFMRRKGWASWYRTAAQGFSPHNHAASLGCPGPVGLFVDGGLSTVGHRVASSQYEDYRLHAFGLEGMHTPGSDTSWFPPDIDATYFQEDDMPAPKDWDNEDWAAFRTNLVPSIAHAVWNFVVRPASNIKNRPAVTEQIAKAALKKAANGE
jgi:hypothetical protein